MTQAQCDWQRLVSQGQALQNQNPTAALAYFQQALQLAPAEPMAYLELTRILLLLDRVAETADCLRVLVTLKQVPAEAWFWLALTEGRLGRAEAAAVNYRQFLERVPDHVQARLNLARLLTHFGQGAEASQHYLEYLDRHPDDLDVGEETALLLGALGQTQEAARRLKAIFAQHPSRLLTLQHWIDFAALHEPLEVARELQRIALIQPALELKMGIQAIQLLERASATAERQRAVDWLLQAQNLTDRAAWQLSRDFYLPYLPASQAEILASYQPFDHSLNHYLQALPADAGIRADFGNLETYQQLWVPFTMMCYLNLDLRSARQRFGKLLGQLLPPLPVQAKPVQPQSPEQPLRMGFVINLNSAVGAFLHHTLRVWPDQEHQICVFIIARTEIPLPGVGEGLGDEMYRVPGDPSECLQQLRDARLDLLFLSEVYASQPLQNLLAAYRIAPVQVTSWLSSGTTGLQHMDYFISSRLLERADNPQANYSERLIELAEIPAYIMRPTLPSQPPQRSDYGLPEGNLYLCPQLIYKFHPDFVQALADILTADPTGQLVLVSNPNLPYLRKQLLARFESRFPQLMPRICLLPKQSRESFLGLLTLGDVMLDPFYFGGGTTSFEALGLGLPMVTWPGERLHGRITYAYYLKMQVFDCVATSPQDYVKLAVRLATDPALNADIRTKIRQTSHLLFENQAAAQELADCLIQLATNGRQHVLADPKP